MSDRATETVALTKSIADWLVAIDITEPALRADISVDLADILAAARQVESDVHLLLERRPIAGTMADDALAVATNIEVQLFTELSSHLDSLRRAWPRLLQRLDALTTEGR